MSFLLFLLTVSSPPKHKDIRITAHSGACYGEVFIRGRGLRVNSTPAASDDKKDLVDSVNTQHIGSLHFYDNLMLIGTMGPLQNIGKQHTLEFSVKVYHGRTPA